MMPGNELVHQVSCVLLSGMLMAVAAHLKQFKCSSQILAASPSNLVSHEEKGSVLDTSGKA